MKLWFAPFALLFAACTSAPPTAPANTKLDNAAPAATEAAATRPSATAPASVQLVAATPAGEPTKSAAKPAPVYDEAAVGKDQIALALAKAKKENRHVLVQWGANWCGWCVLLHKLSKDNKDIAHQLQYEYDVVRVDIGQWDKHMDLAAAYGADLKTHGVPYLTVLDGDGKVLVNQDTGTLEDPAAKAHDPAKVLAFLKKYEAPRVVATSALEAGIAAAAKDGKRVFLHFGAPWCGWCHKLEDWMAKPEIAKLLTKDYIELKIDTDRASGGQELLARYCPEEDGIPWFAVLDEKGTVLADSNGPKGNVGFPAQPEEIDHFVALLKRTRTKLTDEEIAAIERSLAAKK